MEKTNSNRNLKEQGSILKVINNSQLQNVKILEKNPIAQIYIKNQTKKKKYLIPILISLILAFIILSTILVGYFYFGWFQTKQDLVVTIQRNENDLSLYHDSLKIKNTLNNLTKVEGSKEKIISVETDFLVGIKKKTRTHYFGIIDYLYEAYLLIEEMEVNNDGNITLITGYDIDKFETKVKDDKNVPLFKFFFYENGTIKNIYLPENTSEMIYFSVKNIIEKLTPQLSNKLYLESQKYPKKNFSLSFNKKEEKGKLSEIQLIKKRYEKNIFESKTNFTLDNTGLESSEKININGSSCKISEIQQSISFNMNKRTRRKLQNEESQENGIPFMDLNFEKFVFDLGNGLSEKGAGLDRKTIHSLNIISKKINFLKETEFNYVYQNENLVKSQKENIIQGENYTENQIENYTKIEKLIEAQIRANKSLNELN